MHRVEHIMGTAISVDVRDPHVAAVVLDDVFEHFRRVDARMSTFRPDSEVSRLSRGEISEAEGSPEIREVLLRCEAARTASHGYFDIRRHRADGALDPSGLVKGWAVEGAAGILRAAGAQNYAINAGGDIVARGERAPGHPWRVGVRHPRRPDRVATVLAIRDLAVATSGAYERGDHVIDPHTGRPPGGVLSMTVVGPSLTNADSYATAAFAMGRDGLRWIASLPGYAGCSITSDDRIAWTAAFGPLMARA
jgi:thiamine biosynthesis lipoprotein